METAIEKASTSVLDAIYGRRSVREYTSKKIDHSTIRALLDAAVHAPTAMHEEPWVFVVVENPATLKRISDRAKAAIRGTLRLPELLKPEFNIFYNAGTLIVIGAKPLGPFVTADCWLAAENLMLAAHGLGLGTCCIGFALSVLNDPITKNELGIPIDVTAVAAIIVGEPAEAPAAVPRKAPMVVSWQ